MFLPPGTTDVAQEIDDAIGKALKSDLMKLFQRYLEGFDFAKNPKGKNTACERRMLTAKFVNQVVQEFEGNHPTLVKNSGNRTGMSMSIDKSNIGSWVPVKYLIHTSCI